MSYFIKNVVLDIQIAGLDKILRFLSWYENRWILRFLSWYENRWKAYYIKKNFDRYYETVMNVMDMDRIDREMVLGVFSVKEMEKAMFLKKVTDMMMKDLI